MKRNIYVICLIFSIILLTETSCSSIDQINRKNKDLSVDLNNSYKINGTFLNGNQLYNILNDRKTFPNNIKIDSTLLVTISAVNDKTITLDFVFGDKIISTTKMKGKFVNGYFNTRPKIALSLAPFFPILWGPGVCNLSIGLTTDENLVILESHGGIAFFIVLPFFAGGGERGLELKRKN